MGIYDIPMHLLDLAKTVIGLKSDLIKATLDRRLRMADYLDKISSCIENTSASIRKGDRPDKWCGELSEYLDSFVEIVGKEVGEEKIENYRKVLSRAVVVRGMSFAERDAGSKEILLLTLDDASGRFKAFANSLRV